jgi:peptide/nickel transport system substrate-binding protein
MEVKLYYKSNFVAMNRKRLFHVLFFALFIALFSFSACKPDDKKGNVATVRLVSEPDKLNPLTTEDVNAILVTNHVFLPLLDFHPKTFELTPVLAKTRPTIVKIDTGFYKGSIAYIYEIREEAVWDNGSPVTAADFVFTLKTILNRKTGSGNMRSGLDFVKDVVVDAQNPKKFTLYSNKAYILSETNSGTFPIIPEYIYDTEGVMRNYTLADLAKTIKDTTQKADEKLSKFVAAFQSVKHAREKEGIIGCGPYAFDEWVSGQSISIKKKANWWGEKLAATSPFFQAYPDKIIFRPIKDAAAAMSLVQNSELDAISNISPKDYSTSLKDEKLTNQYAFSTFPLPSLAHLGFNCKEPKLADKRTRRAIAHILDVDAVVKNIAGGFGEPSGSCFLPIRPYYDPSLKPIALNIEQAKILLAEAGWKDSNGDGIVDKKIGGKTTELVLRYVFASAAPTKDMGLMLQENGKKAGIGIKLEPVEAPVMLENLKKRNYDIFYNAFGFSPGLDDPKEIWHSTSNTPDGGNRYQFENKQADALIDQIRNELDETKRNELYEQFQTLIYDEQPAIFIYIRQERLAIHKRFSAPVALRRPGFFANTFQLKK